MSEPTLFESSTPRQQTHACTGPDCRHCALTIKPHLPYAGTSGHSGTDTSEERARTRDKSGETGRTQGTLLALLDDARDMGMTWAEVAQITGWHHGTASGALSVLHAEGEIARLTERRARCKVYVLPENVNGRATEQPRKRRTLCPHCGGNL